MHVRVGITEEMPVGTDWEHVPGRNVPCDHGHLVCQAEQPVPHTAASFHTWSFTGFCCSLGTGDKHASDQAFPPRAEWS